MTHEELSWKELYDLTQNSVDPKPFNTVRRSFDNANLSDSELVSRIQERNSQNKSTYLLRLEYERRLGNRE